jgi:hypothetical protein
VTCPGVAQRVLRRVSAAAVMPGGALTCLCACGRWLPVWLPGISLAELTFRRPGATKSCLDRRMGPSVYRFGLAVSQGLLLGETILQSSVAELVGRSDRA